MGDAIQCYRDLCDKKTRGAALLPPHSYSYGYLGFNIAYRDVRHHPLVPCVSHHHHSVQNDNDCLSQSPPLLFLTRLSACQEKSLRSRAKDTEKDRPVAVDPDTEPVDVGFTLCLWSCPIEARWGGSVLLPCWLSPNQSAEGLELRWYRAGRFETPVAFQPGKDLVLKLDSDFQGRASLVAVEELQKGNVSLRIERVSLQDAGQFSCYVSSDQWYEDKSVLLRVTAVGMPPVLRVVPTEDRGRLNVSCVSEGWSPQPRLCWTDDTGANVSAPAPHYSTDPRGLVTASSWLPLAPGSHAWLACIVSHTAGQDGRESRVGLPHQTAVSVSVLTSLSPTEDSRSADWRTAFITLLVLMLLLVISAALFIWKHWKGEYVCVSILQALSGLLSTLPGGACLVKQFPVLPNLPQSFHILCPRIHTPSHPASQSALITQTDSVSLFSDQKHHSPTDKTAGKETEKEQLLGGEYEPADESQYRVQRAQGSSGLPVTRGRLGIPVKWGRMIDAADGPDEPSSLLLSVTRLVSRGLWCPICCDDGDQCLFCSPPVDVTLDVKTAHPLLKLTPDGKKVRDALDPDPARPDSPRRFRHHTCVLGCEGFSSGRQYWEVCLEQKQSWWVGVMAESAWEKQESTCSPRTGFWLLVSDVQGGFRASTDPPVPLPAELRPAKLGVFLDREGGQLSFFNAESRSRIFTFHLEQQEKLYPLFNPGTGDKNPLSICPVSRE
ncbi:TRI39 ligase, partial [Atractosteus spatula]|nr:TRI39 ligase [Atractosteus spatula]